MDNFQTVPYFNFVSKDDDSSNTVEFNDDDILNLETQDLDYGSFSDAPPRPNFKTNRNTSTTNEEIASGTGMS